MGAPLLIAGGGIGGLTLAALSYRRGRECRVFERAPQFAPVGAGIVLQPNAVRALRIGGIEAQVVRRGAITERLQISDSKGRVLSTIPANELRSRFAAGVFGFHRASLHAALVDLIPHHWIRLGATVRSCGHTAESAFVELETGERIEGSGLVAADGLRSVVRSRATPAAEPIYSGYTCWRGVAPRGSLWPAGHMNESWGRGARFGLVAIDGDRIYWFATANATAGGRDASKAEVLQRFAGWHDPIRAVIEATPDDAILRTDIADRDPLERWSDGRITLLGDAAHPMTPNLGQGGGQAIEDAVVLDLCLSKASDIAAAFKDYESRRIARTARVVKEARRLGRIGQIENRAGRVVRDFAVRMTPLSATLGAMRWLYDFDI